MDWLLYDRGLRHEGVKSESENSYFFEKSQHSFGKFLIFQVPTIFLKIVESIM